MYGGNCGFACVLWNIRQICLMRDTIISDSRREDREYSEHREEVFLGVDSLQPQGEEMFQCREMKYQFLFNRGEDATNKVMGRRCIR